jgi:hypothetical protein
MRILLYTLLQPIQRIFRWFRSNVKVQSCAALFGGRTDMYLGGDIGPIQGIGPPMTA